MAKVEDLAFSLSGEQLVEIRKKRKVIPCTLSADIGLGGGIPLGCCVLVGGKAKLGKTTLSLQYAAYAQQMFGCKVFFFNIEGRLTQHVLSQIKGLDLSEKMFEVVMGPAIYDKAGEVISNKKMSAEKWWDAIGRCIMENPNSVIIVDSISNLSSEKEQSESMGYQDRGGRNKLESEFCRKYGDLIVANSVTLFLLTHIQANTSGYGAPLQMKVGNDLRHQADVILFGKNIEKWPEQDGRILGHEMIYYVEASALGPPFLELRIPLRYGYGIDNIRDIVTHCINWSIIKKKSSWFTLPFVDNDGKVAPINPDEMTEDGKYIKFQGENQIRNWLLINKDQQNLLEDIIRKRVLS
jgi:RecA/RadA recombinase